ncbi:MAG TPA: hypothetical protein VLM43_14490, partial [Desulfobacterales bacterium]|nr:hypothetical protein [Desulfobacterales bacterium]
MQLFSQGINRLIMAVMAICLLSGPAWSADKATSSDKEAATVNGKPIFKSEYERELSMFQKRAAQKGRPLSDEDLITVKKQ